MSIRTRVGVVFGGPSREHGVSFLSARCLLENLPSDRFEAVPVFVGKDGRWHGVADSREEMLRYFARPAREALLDGVVPGSRPAPPSEIVASFEAAFRDGAWDVVFPILHGTFGEDGGPAELAVFDRDFAGYTLPFASLNPLVGLAWHRDDLYGVEIFPHDDLWSVGTANLVRFYRKTGRRTPVLTGFATFPNGLVEGPDGALYTSGQATSFVPGDGRVLRIVP